MVSCNPYIWSCKSEMCLNYNFTLPNGQFILRDYQKSSLGMGASTGTSSASLNTAQATTTQFIPSTILYSIVTVEGTPFSTATNTVTATPTSTPSGMISKSASAVISITVGIPLLVLVAVAILIIIRERWRYSRLMEENKKIDAKIKFYQDRNPVADRERLHSWYELSPAAIQLAKEMCTAPPTAGLENDRFHKSLTPARRI